MNNAVILAAEDSAVRNPLLPETYDIVWLSLIHI